MLLSILFFLPSLIFAQSFQFITISDPHLNTSLRHKMHIDPKGYYAINDLDKKTFIILSKVIKKNYQAGVLAKDPDFILCLGDLVGHSYFLKGNRKKAVYHNAGTMFHTMAKIFPNKPIITVFGNNDSSQKNYGKYQFNGQSLYTTAEKAGYKNGFLSTGILCHRNNYKKLPCLLSSNSRLGFFSIIIKPRLLLIGLNSVMFTPWHKTNKQSVNIQLKFLNDMLNHAKEKRQSVLIAMHVPIGANLYDGKNFWRTNIEKQFLKLLYEYRENICGLLVGHTHMDELNAIDLGELIGQYYTPALSTSHGNSPGLRSYTMQDNNGNWYISNYQTFQIHNEKHPKLSLYYQFATDYCSNKTVYNINTRLHKVPIKLLWKHYTVGNPNHPLSKLHDIGAFFLRDVFEPSNKSK